MEHALDAARIEDESRYTTHPLPARQPIYPTYSPNAFPMRLPQTAGAAYPGHSATHVSPSQMRPAVYPPLGQRYTSAPVYPPQHPRSAAETARVRRATLPQPRMAKAQAQALATRVKKWTLGLSLTGFLMFGGLAALHKTATAATSSASTNSGSSSSTNSGSDQSGSQSSSYFGSSSGGGFGSSSSSSAVSESRTS